jgi:hypothetical protein
MAAPVGTGRALGQAMSVMEFDQISMTNSGSKAGFFGVTPVVRPASAAQAALTAVTAVSGAFGFATSAALTAFVAQVENIRASLVLLGLLKGAA